MLNSVPIIILLEVCRLICIIRSYMTELAGNNLSTVKMHAHVEKFCEMPVYIAPVSLIHMT